MGDTADVDPLRLAESLRDDGLIHDAEVMIGPGPETVIAFVVPQGFQPGYTLRERVMGRAGAAGRHIQLMLLWEIPRGETGLFDHDAALAAARRLGFIYRFEPPAGEIEQTLVDLVQEVLPDRQISMTDSFVALGGDSLTTVELVMRLRECFDVDVDPQRIFDAESLRDLAGLLPANRSTDRPGHADVG